MADIRLIGIHRIRRKKDALILYSVTTIVPGYPNEESQRKGGKRTVAICTTLKRAREIIESNEGDIFETSYRYVVIEGITADALYCYHPGKQYWYHWKGTSEKGKYIRGRRPKEFGRIIGWWE
ncbi:MAG TPA: hypothetical protein VJC12_02395 [Candidatus Paceibacterota bacterium]